MRKAIEKDDVIKRITEALRSTDGDTVAEVYNHVVDGTPIEYDYSSLERGPDVFFKRRGRRRIRKFGWGLKEELEWSVKRLTKGLP